MDHNNMDHNYCGKDCAVCEYHNECKGCDIMGRDCDIAECCRQRGHATCETCLTKDRCAKLLRKDHKHEERQEASRRAMFLSQENEVRAATMAPVLWKIFWLMVVANVLSLLGFIPALNRIVTIFGYVAAIIVAMLVLTLKDVDKRFWTAGCCAMAAALLNLAGLFIGSNGFVTLLSLASSVCSLFAMYYELNTMGEIVGQADVQLGQNWHNLWKYRMIALVTGIGCVLLVFIAAALAAIILLGVALAVLTLSVMQMVYYYKTAKLYDSMIAQ